MKRSLWLSIGTVLLICVIAVGLFWNRMLPVSERMDAVVIRVGGWWVQVGYDPYSPVFEVDTRIDELHGHAKVAYKVVSTEAGAPLFEGTVEPKPLQETLTLRQVTSTRDKPLTRAEAERLVRSYKAIVEVDGTTKVLEFAKGDVHFFTK